MLRFVRCFCLSYIVDQVSFVSHYMSVIYGALLLTRAGLNLEWLKMQCRHNLLSRWRVWLKSPAGPGTVDGAVHRVRGRPQKRRRPECQLGGMPTKAATSSGGMPTPSVSRNQTELI